VNKIVLYSVAGILIALMLVAVFELYSPLRENIISTTTPTSFNYNFVLCITDPPLTIGEVENIYLNYQNVYIHYADKGNWLVLNSSGTLELKGLANFAQVLGVAKLPSGKYDLLKFTSLNVTIDYEGTNYTAILPTNDLAVTISPPLDISDEKSKALLVQLVPRVIMNPTKENEFIFIPYSKTIIIDNVNDLISNITSINLKQIIKEQLRIPIRNPNIIKNLINMSKYNTIEIFNASLSSSSLSFALNNTGNDSIELKLLFVYSEFSFKGKQRYFISGVFKFSPNGDLEYIPVFNPQVFKEIYTLSKGFVLEPHETKTFHYEGKINLFYFIKEAGKGFSKLGNRMIESNLSFTLIIIGEPLVFVSITLVSS
jgi:hypothetical protein